MPQSVPRGGALTRDGLFELLTGLGLGGAGYLLLPVSPPHPDRASLAFMPVLVAALLLPALKAIVRRIKPNAPSGERLAAGWGWLLATLLLVALGAAALVLVWVEVDSPLLGVAVGWALAVLGHLPAALGLAIGLVLITVGFAHSQWRTALLGMAWAVCGLGVDVLLWGRVLPLWYAVMFTTRHATALYLLALGGLTALVGLIALVCFLAARSPARSAAALDR